MNNNGKSFLILILSFFSFFAYAQEICDNGIDDDGDGRIDCYDGECSENAACDDFFFGNTVTCSDDVDVTTFAIRQQWGSADETATSHATPAIGDLDRNGIPEVVTTNNKGSLDLFVLNGATGATIASADIGFTPENAPVIADVNNDETGDIIVSQNKGDDIALYNVDVNAGTLTRIWRKKASVNQPIGLPGVADFDEDGDVEIYYRNEIMDAATGNVLIAGDGNWETDYLHGTIAADILDDSECADCAGLELVSGNEVWAINEATATRTLVKDMDDVIHATIDANLNYYPKYYPNWDDQWSAVSVADYNLDGHLDLIMSGALGNSTDTYNGETTIFFWDVFNETVITYHDPTNNFVRGPGRINIGDVDGDGQLNANFVMDQKLYSLDENFGIHWIHPIKEGSSGFTGCSLFDFDGDGAVEVVYRSEESLLIVDGVGNGDNTTSERREIACVSRTQEEYPVIADVDGDGSSEICVSCYFNNNTPFSPYNNTQFSHIRVYESDGEAWMPSRGVWNQHGYYNVNINDDLTIPTEVQDHSVVFSEAGTCEYADGSAIPFDSRPLNTFLNQAPILNEQGCVEFVSPDIDFVGILDATDAACPDAEITVTFQITNIGDIDISGNLPVSYYSGDPRLATGSILLDTEVTLLENFEVGETLDIVQTITGIGGDFELFVVINDNGSTPPIEVPLPTSTIPECDTENNIQSTSVGFQRFDLISEKLNDNRKCDPAKPNNGSARAYYFGTTPQSNGSIWLENFEDLSNGAQSDTDETAWTSAEGSFSANYFGVSAYNGSNMFEVIQSGGSNDTGEVTWSSEGIDISDYTDVTVTMDLFENGKQESSGEWRDFITVSFELRDNDNNVSSSGQFINGSHFGNFTYEQAFLTGVNNSNQDDSLLFITVVVHNTSTSEKHYIDNINVEGTPIPTPFEQTEPEGFVFNWYNLGDTTNIIYTGSTFPQMDAGTYIVEGYYGATLCYSQLDTVTIDLVIPTVYAWIYEVSPLSDCDIPNGQLSAFVYTQTDNGTFPASATNIPLDTLGTSDGYKFKWRITSDATNTIIATGQNIGNLSQQGYTVVVEEDLTGCTTTADLTVSSALTFPDAPDVTVDPITTCSGTGELSASINGNTTDYTFYWYDGNGVKPTEDFIGVTYQVDNPGEYTVVAIDNGSSCPSDHTVAVMVDNSVAPTPTVAADADNTSCVAGNGIVSADGDGVGTVLGYTFEWFIGSNTLPANALPGAAAPGAFLVSDNPYQLGGLEGGTYTVRVTDEATDCFEVRTVVVDDTPGSLVVDETQLVVNDIDSCDPSVLGSIDASGVVPGDPNDVSIGNINSSFEALDILSDNNHSQSFDGGNIKTYEQEFINGWSTTAPDTRIEIWHNNNSISGGLHDAFHGDQFAEINANSDAALYFDLATVPGALLNWSFAHKGRAGLDELSVNIGSPGAEVIQDTFSTSNTAWAFYEGEYTIPTDQFTTRFQFEAVSTAGGNNTVGNFVDTVSFVLFPYRFELYEGASASGDADYVNTTGVFENLDDGVYTLVVYDNLTGCGAVEIQITIDRNQDQPIIAATPTGDPSCVIGDGTIDVTASMPGNEPSSYTYELFDGHSFTTSMGSETIADGSVPFTFDNAGGYDIEPGNYRVRVTNEDTKCTDFVDVVVDNDNVVPAFSASQTVNDNTACSGSPNGFVSVSIDEVGFNANNYRFYWYDGADTSSPRNPGGTVGANSQSGLAAGDYTVVAERIGTGCQTVELTLTVNDDPLNVVIKSSPPSPQTSCDIGNGSIQVVADGLAMGGFSCNDCVGSDGFTFEWFFGGDDSNPLDNSFDPNLNVSFNADNTEVYGLVAGSYTVRVTEDATQCSNTQTIVINTDFDIPDPSAVATPNAVCDDAIAGAFNGTLTISGTDDGGAIDFSSGDYQITLFEGVGTGGASTVQTTNNVFDELENGSYTVVIENTTTGCTSNPETYNVGLNVTDFSGDINAAVSPQISCDLSNPLGEIVADVAGTTTGYTFQLFRSGTEILTNITDNSPTNITYSNLSSGNYRLVVTEQATGCDFDEDIEIQPNRVDPVFSNENTSDNERCNSPNGSVSFDIDAGGGADTRAGASYFAEIFEGSSITPSSTAIDDDTQTGPSASFSFGGLVEGDYIVRVTDQTTNCVSISSVFNVGYDGPVIEITPGAILEDLPADCFTDGGRIDISAAINIDNPGAETVEVIWYLGTDATPGQEISGMVGSGLFTNTTFSGAGTVSSTNPAGPVVATDLILDRIPAVNYTAVIRLSNGCEEQIVIDLPELAAPELTFTPGQPTNCDATNGSIQIDITTNAAIPGDVASNYQYTIHEGFYSVPPDLTAGTPYDPSLPDGTVRAFTNFTSATNMGSEIETNLDPGDYTVVVRRDPGSPLSADECPVGVFAFTLEAPPVPILGTPVVTDNTFCGDGADGGIEYNGMVEVTATYDGAPADFTFTLNEVNGAVYTPIPDGTNTFNGEDDFEVIYDPDTDNNGTDDDLTITGLAELPAGRLYAIIAEEVTSGCQDTVVFNLSNEPITNVLAGTEADIQDCVPGTGNFTVDTYPPSENESNYEFTWLDETGTPEAPVAGPGAGSRDYTAEGDYHVIARNLTNGCETQIDFSISNLSEVPEVAVNVSASDAFCTPNTGNGALEAVLIGGFNASDYIFEWYQGSSVDGDSLLANPEAGEGIDVTIDGYIIGGTNGEAITGLKEGEYTVNVTDNNGLNIGCFTTVVKSVPELQQIPTLTLSGIEVSPDSICGAGTSGQFIIDDADFTPGDVSDYTITVERNTVGSGILIASTASDATSVTYGNLDPGTYFITAIKDASGTPSENTGCSIAPVKVVVKDSTRNPQVALVSMTPNEDCGGGVNVGGLEILIDEKFDHTDHFDVQWYAGFDAVGGNEIGGENAVTLNGYPSGQYSVLVRNQHTDCEIFRNYTITNVPLNPSIQTYDVVDNNICDDDNDGTPVDVGSFELLTARFDGSPLNQAAMNGFYRLEVYDNLSDANAGNFGSAIADGDGDNTNFIYTELSAGTYFAIVRKLDSDCISEPTTFDIVDDVDRPIVSITLAQADENCGGIGTPNGALDAYASVGGVTGIDHTTNPAEYTFQWYYNGSAMADGVDPGNGSVPAGVATSSVSGLFADTYEVEFTRISTGCVVREEFILPIQEINVEILSVDTTAATNCVGNGIIEVTSVNRNTLSDYRFDFYDQDPTVGGPAPVFSVNGLATPAYNMAIGGTTYFIVGTNNILGCETPVFEIPVGENVAYPRRTESVQFEDQTNCDPSNPNGSLSIVIDNVVPAAPDYTVEWFFGDNTTNTLDDGDIGGFGTLMGETTATVSGLPSGEYTYRVTSTATGCSVSELLEVKDDIPNPLLLSPSSSPNTNCVNPDGILSVNIINRVDGHTYEYYWYAGTLADVGPSPNPLDADFTGSEVENLDDGTYVVFVVDQTDTFCQSNAIEVEVEDGTTPPMFDLETGNVTVCFDEKDGYALVSSPDISDYSFAWFDEGNNLIDTTLFVGSLDAGLYRIQATDRTTGCIASEVFEIFNDAVTPNDPFVVVNSGRDNCQINNGSAVANVDGVTSNYLFEWFDPANMNTPYATGSQVFNLDSITYLVRATDITTGCESGFTQISVPYEQVDPSFTVDVENSICLRTEDGATNQFTGTATIQFDEFNLATDYEWIFLATGEVVGTDSRLIDAFPGEYGVRFFAENGCDYYAEFSIETELNIYNGVSANGDGRNDFFLIDCVDYFPGNNVKIFNRAGQRVYEVDNYDNISVRFEGVSNVGGGGLILPPGTYFYLVDLGTGEDPIQGYLELVR